MEHIYAFEQFVRLQLNFKWVFEIKSYSPRLNPSPIKNSQRLHSTAPGNN